MRRASRTWWDLFSTEQLIKMMQKISRILQDRGMHPQGVMELVSEYESEVDI